MAGKKDKIHFWGEFVDKDFEKEFFIYDMRRNTHVLGTVALIFGILYMLFLITDYYVIEDPSSFRIILMIRSLFLMGSLIAFLIVKKIKNYGSLAYLITAYEVLAIMGFIIILSYYESLTILLFFSVIAINIAIYFIPNKIKYSQLVSVLLNLSVFIFHVNKIKDVDTQILHKIIAYYFIIVIFCNIGAYLNNYYKRKQFADSRELQRMSETDPLTGIYNRMKFNEALKQWIYYSKKNASPLSLVMFDIDDFKKVNDKYGHLTGDSVLQSVALTIKNAIRNTDIFARWGGEEFVILLPNTDIKQATEMMERMRVYIQNSKFNVAENISCSFGIVGLRNNENEESLLHRVNKFLYDAKGCGKNAVVTDSCQTDERIIESPFLEAPI